MSHKRRASVALLTCGWTRAVPVRMYFKKGTDSSRDREAFLLRYYY